MRNNQKGFAHLGILLLVVIFAAVAGGGYYVWHRNHKSNNSTSVVANHNTTSVPSAPTQKKSPNPYIGWNTYTAKLGKFTLRYPQTWKVERNDSSLSDVADPDEFLSLKSPSGITVNYSYSQFSKKQSLGTPSDFTSCGTNSQCYTNAVYSISHFNSGAKFGQLYLIKNGLLSIDGPGKTQYSINLYKPLVSSNLPKVGENTYYHKMLSYLLYDKASDLYAIYAMFPSSTESKSSDSVFSSTESKNAALIMESFASI